MRTSLRLTCLRQDLAERVADERGAPEPHRAFQTNAVWCGHEHAIGDGMGTLDGNPRLILFLSELSFSARCQPIAVG